MRLGAQPRQRLFVQCAEVIRPPRVVVDPLERYKLTRQLPCAFGVTACGLDAAQRDVRRLMCGTELPRQLVLLRGLVEPILPLGKTAEKQVRKIADAVVRSAGKRRRQIVTRARIAKQDVDPPETKPRDRHPRIELERA